jgi:hypothetical protein
MDGLQRAWIPTELHDLTLIVSRIMAMVNLRFARTATMLADMKTRIKDMERTLYGPVDSKRPSRTSPDNIEDD